MIIRPITRLIACSRPLATRYVEPRVFTQARWASSSPQQWSTPLAKNIAKAIETTGPISIAAFMRQCLTSPDGGYYTASTQGKDPFGERGDFITSPEISQVFGELIGLWVVAEWIAQGKPSHGVEILEVGPGRGTLMADMLRTLKHFDHAGLSIESLYLVESSAALREAQKRLLCADAPLQEVDIGLRSTTACTYSQIPVTWCEDIRFVPKDPTKTPFIVAHEFFDALPIHAFQSVAPNPNKSQQSPETTSGPLPLSKPSPQSQSPQWRELVVSPAPMSSISTSSSHTLERTPEFQLSVAKASNPNSLLLPKLSPRYEALLPTAGSVIEISPESYSYAADFAQRIGGSPPSKDDTKQETKSGTQKSESPIARESPSGAALILDYGPASTIPTSTLRGVRAHQSVSPFTDPGLVDVSADVDFIALTEAALAASAGVEVHGPMEQGTWLESMGIRERGEALRKGLGNDEEGKERVKSAIERLVERGGGGMGRIYKVLAIVPERGGKRPVGFGGEL